MVKGGSLNKRLLIVDDEPDIVELIRDRAKVLDFDCEIELTGEGCIPKAHEFQPHLVLLDMNLPRISGFGILREMKCDGRLSSIPIIVLSATSQAEVITEAMNMGAAAYFVKGGEMNDLFKLIREYV